MELLYEGATRCEGNNQTRVFFHKTDGGFLMVLRRIVRSWDRKLSVWRITDAEYQAMSRKNFAATMKKEKPMRFSGKLVVSVDQGTTPKQRISQWGKKSHQESGCRHIASESLCVSSSLENYQFYLTVTIKDGELVKELIPHKIALERGCLEIKPTPSIFIGDTGGVIGGGKKYGVRGSWLLRSELHLGLDSFLMYYGDLLDSETLDACQVLSDEDTRRWKIARNRKRTAQRKLARQQKHLQERSNAIHQVKTELWRKWEDVTEKVLEQLSQHRKNTDTGRDLNTTYALYNTLENEYRNICLHWSASLEEYSESEQRLFGISARQFENRCNQKLNAVWREILTGAGEQPKRTSLVYEHKPMFKPQPEVQPNPNITEFKMPHRRRLV